MRDANDDRRTTNGGFSLLEIIVAMVILSLLGAGLFATVSYSKRMAIRNEEKLTALSLIEEKLGELKKEGARNLTVTETVTPKPLAPLLNGEMTTTIAYGESSTTPPENFKEVTVKVEWRDRWLGAGDSNRNESISTVFYQS